MLTHKHAQPDLMYMPYKINIKSVNYNLISPFSAALYVVRFALTLSLPLFVVITFVVVAVIFSNVSICYTIVGGARL